MKRRAGLALPLALLLPPARARSLRVRRGQSLADAVAQAADGDVIELDPGDHHAQTAVITQRRLVVRAAEGRAVLHADGAHAEGKAMFVVRGGQVTIEGLEFRGSRVPAGNGAGIRFERGALTLRRCGFFDNEMGLLSSGDAGSTLAIEDCAFGAAPPWYTGQLHHLLYVGRIARLRVAHSRFSGGWRGHLLKSRAALSHIVCNRLVDGEDGEASYQIDLPNGGLACVQGNVIAQGARAQNLALVAYGAEAEPHPQSRLLLRGNHLLNDAEQPASFVRWWPERLPENSEPVIEDNLFVGEAAAGSWGRPEDGNRLLPASEREQALAPPPCLPDCRWA